jgi:2',3'-cyclic-nucleotide 2'-phosphodiesterase (5'-nucleotidase family)
MIRLCCAVAILVFGITACGTSESIQILHFNDFHAMLLPAEKVVKVGDKEERQDDGAGAARLAKAVFDRKAKDPDSLVLFGGDALQGTAFSTLFKGEESYSIMDEFVNVATLGNHEFDYGQENLKRLLSRAKFDVVCANLLDDKEENFVSRGYVIKEVKGFRIAIFGLLTPDTSVTTHPKNVGGLTFVKPAEVAKQLVSDLREKEKADIVIALTHLGSNEDVKLAKEVSGIDIIVGGHSHTALTNGIQEGKTRIVQAGLYGKYLGVVKLKVDRKAKKILSIDSKLIPMTPDLKKDAKIEAIVAEYNEKLGAELQQVIARATVRLEGEKSKVRNEETNLGNLICDITRDIAKTDLAVVNGGGIRDSIAAGEIKVNDIVKVIPFDNTIYVVRMPGSAIAGILDRVAAKDPEKGNFLQISSGSGYTIKDGKAIDIIINGAPINPERVYSVATSDFVAAGGDGFVEFLDYESYDTGFVMRDALIDVIRARGTINAAVDGRIKRQ